MRVEDLPEALAHVTDIPTVRDEDVIAHYQERGYEQISYHGRLVYLFTNERNFGDAHHTVSFHGANAPIVPEYIYQYAGFQYAYKGTWGACVDGNDITLRPGDTLVSDRNVPQSMPRTGPDTLGVSIVLAEEFFRTHLLDRVRNRRSRFEYELVTLGASHNQWRHYPTADDDFVRRTMELIICERLDPTPASGRILDALIEGLLAHLLGIYEDNEAGPTEGRRSLLMGDIREYIALNYREGNLGKMAETLGYQPSYLCRVIKESTGSTFKQLVNAERMKRATVLLQGDDLAVYEVAEAVGLPNLTSFYKRFREWSGSTPKEWRDRLREEG